MIERMKQSRAAQWMGRLSGWAQESIAPALLRRRVFGVAVVASLLAMLYWGVIASNRYVSEARIIIQRTDVVAAQSIDFASLLGNNNAPNRADQLLLRDYLLSTDMLQKLEEKLHLREHYSSWSNDIISQMWFKDASLEIFHRYFLSRVSVEYDEFSGVLVIQAQGYDPEMAKAIASAMVEEGEQFMNRMGHDLAQSQVEFLEKQVKRMSDDASQAREQLIAFQNKHGLVSPQATAENFASIISRLEASLAELQTRKTSMSGYLMPNSATIVDIDLQIAAVEKQIEQEKKRLASPKGKALNKTVEQYQTLQLQADFALEVYKTGLIALEKGRLEATRTLKKVSVIQRPTLPEYSLEPRRIYNTIVFILVALLIAGIVHLLAAIIRDHKD